MAEKFKEENLGQIILKKPHITEKASDLSALNNAYVFIVSPHSNKKEIKKAVEEIYKVKPIKINIINQPSKSLFSRGKKGVKSGYKKAVVYLKKEDKIELI